MRGSTRKRGGWWEYRLELGPQPAQLCQQCGEVYWLEGRPRDACSCGGRLEHVERRRQRSQSGFKTEKSAQAALVKAMTAVAQGDYVEPSKLTVSAYLLREWLPSIEAALRPSTYESYRGHVEDHIVPRLGTVRLQKLSPDAIGRFYRDLLDDGKVHRPKPKKQTQGKEVGEVPAEDKDAEQAAPVAPEKHGLSPVTVRHIHVTLHRALRDAVRRGRVVRNACDAVDIPKANRTDPREMKVWSADEVKAFLEATRGDRLAPMWRVMVDRGLRRGEACGLKWDDVDLDAARLSVRRALVSSGYTVHVSEPKTKKGRRVLPLNAATIASLKEQAARQGQDAEKWGDAWTDSGFVFTAENGEPWHPDRISKLFDKAVDAAAVPSIRLHDLRHTCAVLHLKAGVHPKVVQELLGHATISITLDTYSHVMPGMQEEAAEKIGALLTRAT
jgi:integrase